MEDGDIYKFKQVDLCMEIGYSKGFFMLFKFRFYLYSLLNSLLLFFPNLMLRARGEYLFIMQDHGIGDALTLTSIVRNWKKPKRVILISLSPESYAGLNVKNIGLRRNFFSREIISFLGNSNHSNIIGYSNGNLLFKSSQFYAKDKKEHLRELLLWGRKDIRSKIKAVKRNVCISFSKTENKLFSEKFSNILNKRYSLIVCGDKKDSTKLWPSKKFQEVIDKTNDNVNWVQVGTAGCEKLNNTVDLRGKTSLREVFFIVSKADSILCSEGMYTHLSSAFNVPCITIYSGFHNPDISSYDNVTPIVPNPLPKCAYCWKTKCDLYDYPICLESISVSDVINNVLTLNRNRD